MVTSAMDAGSFECRISENDVVSVDVWAAWCGLVRAVSVLTPVSGALVGVRMRETCTPQP